MNATKMIASLIFLLSLPSRLPGSMDSFLGEWKAAGNGLTKVQIRISGSQLRLPAFGRCHPEDCDWGEVDAQPYAPEACPSVTDTAEVISAEFITSFARRLLLAYPTGTDRPRIEVFTVFTDRSGRSPYHAVTLLTRTGLN
jgi:hypothetical protein